jgi:Ca2+-binding RTX toxin-like protein
MSRHILVIPLALSLVVSNGLAAPPTPTPAPPPLCNGKPATIFGLSGTIKGTNGPDVIVGSPQADVIVGRGGADRICGSDGDDRIDGGPDNDRLYGEGGDDLVKGGLGHDIITDLVSPGLVCLSDQFGPTDCFGSQRLEGGDGDDKITGIGNIFGDAGDDTIALDTGDADGGPGNDQMTTTAAPSIVDGPDFLGGDGDDVIDGDSGTDSIRTEVDGGSGFDACVSDANDVESGCEV